MSKMTVLVPNHFSTTHYMAAMVTYGRLRLTWYMYACYKGICITFSAQDN